MWSLVASAVLLIKLDSVLAVLFPKHCIYVFDFHET